MLATVSSTAATGGFSQSSGIIPDVRFDNQSCTYRLEVRLGNTTAACDSSLFFGKARIEWIRSIPPAPATATFTDVPTDAQFFREIEALAASGITAGCNATDFCPENLLTRRQMAAFLARALGLPSQTIPDPANP